jgi:glycosyltransferase involved in cell wall biosynthesis
MPEAKKNPSESSRGPIQLLYYTDVFAPIIVNYAMLLAQGIAAHRDQAGSRSVQITVVTPTPAGAFDDRTLPFRVIRRSSPARLWGLIGRADAIQLAGPCFLPLLFSLMRRRPVVIEHHGYQAVCPNGLLFFNPAQSVCPGYFQSRQLSKCVQCNAREIGWVRSLRDTLMCLPRQWMASRVSSNVCITHHVARRLRLPRSLVIHYGVAPAAPPAIAPVRIAPLAIPPSVAAGRKALVFAFAGRFVPEKGLSVLLRACKVLKDSGVPFELRLIGDGPERMKLESLAQQLSIADAVLFTGLLQGEAYEKMLADVDVMVMPSLWEETAGLSAIEQMARGRAVVVSDLGGLAEVVGDAGLKSPPGSAAALAACLRRLVDEPGLLDSLGRLARKRAQEMFSLDRMVEEHRHLFEGLPT